MSPEFAIRRRGQETVLMGRDHRGHWHDIATFHGVLPFGHGITEYRSHAELAETVARLLNVSGLE